MKNLKCVFVGVAILCLLPGGSSCKKTGVPGVFAITSGKGYVYIDGISFLTRISFTCEISNLSDVPGVIDSWKFVFKSGGTVQLEITSENCRQYNIVKFDCVPIHPHSVREINGESIPIIKRSVFPSGGPDNMEMSVIIIDDNDNQVTLRGNAPVTYSEYND
jgi:hypothetical protein